MLVLKRSQRPFCMNPPRRSAHKGQRPRVPCVEVAAFQLGRESHETHRSRLTHRAARADTYKPSHAARAHGSYPAQCQRSDVANP